MHHLAARAMASISAACTILVAPALFAATSTTVFMPENRLDLQDNLFQLSGGITEAEFNAVIDRHVAIYAPIIQAHGGTLSVSRRWTDATVNANASQSGNDWHINMYGGL